MKKVPLAKPDINKSDIDGVVSVLKSGWLSLGPRLRSFEQDFAAKLGLNYAVAVNSGTSSLLASLYALDIKQDDEVLVPSFTFVATVNAITAIGAKPVFVDVEDDTFNIDPTKIEQKITKKTKAILVVDLFGHLCDYDVINKIAKNNNLILKLLF